MITVQDIFGPPILRRPARVASVQPLPFRLTQHSQVLQAHFVPSHTNHFLCRFHLRLCTCFWRRPSGVNLFHMRVSLTRVHFSFFTARLRPARPLEVLVGLGEARLLNQPQPALAVSCCMRTAGLVWTFFAFLACFLARVVCFFASFAWRLWHECRLYFLQSLAKRRWARAFPA